MEVSANPIVEIKTQEPLKKKTGRPKKKGQKCTVQMYIRPWTAVQLKRSQRLGESSYDDVISRLVKESNKNDRAY
jgi:hypothetical protein